MVRIIADTTSGLHPSEAEKLGIPYLPQIIIFGDKQYRDDTEIDNITFLKKLINSSDLPKTAAPPPELYIPIFKEILQKNDSIIVLCPSSELSGTFRGASIAAQEFADADIRIIDTKTIGSGLATLVKQADQWAKQGMGSEEIANNVNLMATREIVYFLVDTLEYLHKGGRIGGAQALFGSLLQVKPILTLKNGRAEPAESQRTKNKAIARLKELVVDQYPKNKNGFLSIMHGGVEVAALSLASDLSIILGINIGKIPVYFLPPAILTHAGPGVLGVSFYK